MSNLLGFSAGRPFYDIGQLFILIMVIRAVLSYFPYSADSPLNPVRRIAFVITEPVLGPFRRIIPPAGMLDISYLVAFIVVEIVNRAILYQIHV
jgi:YggT family protein